MCHIIYRIGNIYCPQRGKEMKKTETDDYAQLEYFN